MARIRTIKPEFWTDAKSGTMSEFSKCLFIGLLNHSDDFGVIEWEPEEWRAKIFPYHSDTTPGTVQKSLTDELLPRGMVIWFGRKADDGETKAYLFIRNFDKHQVINKPSKPLLTGWKKSDTPESYAKRHGEEFQSFSAETAQHSQTIPPPLPEHSLQERKGKEGKGKDSASLPSGEGVLPDGLQQDSRTADAQLFGRAREVMGKDCGGLVSNLKKHFGGNVALARSAIEQASTKDDPREYISRILRGPKSQMGDPAQLAAGLWDKGM